MTDMLSILLPAWCLAAVLGCLSAPLGCMMVWRNMSFFADTLAHGTLLGIAFATLLQLPPWLGLSVMSVLLVAILWFFEDKRLPMDALLALCSAALLCVGLVLFSLNPSLNSALMGYLFGDILLTDWHDVVLAICVVVLGLALLRLQWRQQIKLAFDEDIALSEGISAPLYKLGLMLLLALFTVIAMRIAGSILMTALLIMPALTARLLARSQQSMVMMAWLCVQLSIVCGLLLSARYDMPSGPSIVLVMAFGFAVVFAASKAKHLFAIKAIKP